MLRVPAAIHFHAVSNYYIIKALQYRYDEIHKVGPRTLLRLPIAQQPNLSILNCVCRDAMPRG